MNRLYCFLLGISLFFPGLILFAQEESSISSAELNEITCTATRIERPAQDVPAGISVVGKEEIKDTRMFGIKESLNGLAGVQAETKNGGYDTRLIIRGAGLKARYGVREIMVLLDGVPITDPDGMSRLDFVDSEMVESIEVLKGPNSTLYGANAAGGVVSINTKQLFEETKSIKAGYGNDNTQSFNGVYGTHFGDTYVSVSGSRRTSESWREWNVFRTAQGGLKAGHIFDEQTSVEANISYTNAGIQLPGTLTEEQYDDDITQYTAEQWRNMGRYSKVLYTSLKGEKSLGKVALKPLVYYQKWTHYHPVTGMINDGGARVYGADLQGAVPHGLWGARAALTMGVAGQVDKSSGEKYTYRDYVTSTSGRLLYSTSDEKGLLAEEEHDTVSKWGIYAQESLCLGDNWLVDTGLRYDRVDFDINIDRYREYSWGAGRYITNNETVRREQDFRRFSPRLGVVYKLAHGLNLYGNIATGFQTPQSSELEENPDLKPAKTYNYETGLKARSDGGHSLDLALFFISVEDDIVQTMLENSQSSYSNAGKTRKKGLELTARVQPLTGLQVGGAYSYNDFRFAEFNEVISGVNYSRDGNRLPYIPKHQYTLFAQYRHASHIRCKLETSTWGRYEVDNANTERYKGYALITNALIGYEKDGFEIVADVYNLFDVKHAIEVSKDSSGTRKYRPGAPMTWMLRVGYQF